MSRTSYLSILTLLSLYAKLIINYSFFKRMVTLFIVCAKLVLHASIKMLITFKTLFTLYRALILILLKVFRLLLSNVYGKESETWTLAALDFSEDYDDYLTALGIFRAHRVRRPYEGRDGHQRRAR